MNACNNTELGGPERSDWVFALLWMNCCLGIVLTAVNAGILFASKYTSGGKSPTLIFIRSLCVADAFVGLAPVVKATERDPQMMCAEVKTNCFLGESVLYTSILASSCLVLGFSADNYLRMVSPVRYMTIVDKSLVITFMIFIWNFAFIFGFLPQMGWNAEDKLFLAENGHRVEHHSCQLFEYYSTSYVITVAILISMAIITTYALHLDFFTNVQRKSFWSHNFQMFRKNMVYMNATRIELVLTTVVITCWFTYIIIFSKVGLFYEFPNSENYYLILYTVVLAKSLASTVIHITHAEQILRVLRKGLIFLCCRRCKRKRGISRDMTHNATVRSTISVISIDDSPTSSSRDRACSIITTASASLDSLKLAACRSASNETQVSILPTSARHKRSSILHSPVLALPELRRSQSLCNLKAKSPRPLRVTFSDSTSAADLANIKKQTHDTPVLNNQAKKSTLVNEHEKPVPTIVLHEVVTADVHQESPKSSEEKYTESREVPDCTSNHSSDSEWSPRPKRPLVRSNASLWPFHKMDSLKVPKHSPNRFKKTSVRSHSKEFVRVMLDLKSFQQQFDLIWKAGKPSEEVIDKASCSQSNSRNILKSDDYDSVDGHMCKNGNPDSVKGIKHNSKDVVANGQRVKNHNNNELVLRVENPIENHRHRNRKFSASVIARSRSLESPQTKFKDRGALRKTIGTQRSSSDSAKYRWTPSPVISHNPPFSALNNLSPRTSGDLKAKNVGADNHGYVPCDHTDDVTLELSADDCAICDAHFKNCRLRIEESLEPVAECSEVTFL